MRKSDVIVEEVVCSETGKPMAKIPLWMAGMKVRFVSDEARQKHPAPLGIPDIDPIRKIADEDGGSEELKDLDVVAAVEPDAEFEDLEVEENSDEEAEPEV